LYIITTKNTAAKFQIVPNSLKLLQYDYGQ